MARKYIMAVLPTIKAYFSIHRCGICHSKCHIQRTQFIPSCGWRSDTGSGLRSTGRYKQLFYRFYERENNLCMSEMKKIYITGLGSYVWHPEFRRRLMTSSNGVTPGMPGQMSQVSWWTVFLLPMPNCTERITTVISATITKQRSMECRSGSKVHHSSERLFTDGFVLIRSYFRQGYERFDVYPPRILSRRPPGVHTRT